MCSIRQNLFTVLIVLGFSESLFSCKQDIQSNLIDKKEVGALGHLSQIFPEETFNEFFPETVTDKWGNNLHPRNPVFTYESLMKAAAVYPIFCNEGTEEQKKQELCAFLANCAHETTGGWSTAPGGPYAWGLHFVREVGCYDKDNPNGGVCTAYATRDGELAKKYPPQPGRTYYGRGALQLSWNYNYGYCSDQLGYGDLLLREPDRVAEDGHWAFLTAIWFWMTPQAPKPSCHDIMSGKWVPNSADSIANRYPGFGMTINVINGGIECGYGSNAQMDNRIGYYKHFLNIMKLDTTDCMNCSCGKMRPY